MQTLSVLFLTLGMLPSLIASSSSVINTTCSKIPEISYDYCVGVLSAEPIGKSASDMRGLAVAAANLTIHNVTSTLHMMSNIVAELNSCNTFYKYMVDLIVSAIDDLHKGRDAELIYEKLHKASDTPENCDIALFQGAQNNPVQAENSENKALARIASGITFIMSHGGS
ncbi:hypothetical protein ZWY2020_019276 [Hordeum vulgare]|uniref:Pectinesterase inhibitor domain-containing protein n=1 Tax=Hordeum vulgare subsp. vulgare TaxID=112509 RepID=A0A8I7BFY0_HORVV|nr:hypothetical protein ZWY2020_019276 [Hordeum vulgare]